MKAYDGDDFTAIKRVKQARLHDASEDKYPIQAQMLARIYLATQNRGSCNYGFFGGDDEAVVRAAKKIKVSIPKFLRMADEYLAGDGLG